MKGKGISPVQGYNAQAAATVGQIVVAAEVTNAPADASNFVPITTAVDAMLHQAGHEQSVGTIVADAGYWSTHNATVKTNAEVLIATGNKRADGGHRALSVERRFVIERVHNGELTLRQGAELLGISYTWFTEMAKHYTPDQEGAGRSR
jgi:hypothetical protein